MAEYYSLPGKYNASVIKIMNFNMSFDVDEAGMFVGISSSPLALTRRVLIEKYIIKYEEFEMFGFSSTVARSVYVEPDYFDKEDDEIKLA